MKSEKGKSAAGGAISRYVLEDEVDATILSAEVTDMAENFRPLMESIRAERTANMDQRLSQTGNTTREFADRFENLILEFETARDGPFGVVKPLSMA